MQGVKEIHALMDEYKERVRVVCVYIVEAHAADEWPVGNKVSFCEQPKTLDERVKLANQFVRQHGLRAPLLVDTMNNCFQKSFSAWPFRFYAVTRTQSSLHSQWRVTFKAQPDGQLFGYDWTQLHNWLAQLPFDT